MMFYCILTTVKGITFYTSQTRDQKCFTVSEVAADWHEVIPHSTAPISYTKPSPRSP